MKKVEMKLLEKAVKYHKYLNVKMVELAESKIDNLLLEEHQNKRKNV
jgi:hypothetical protein